MSAAELNPWTVTDLEIRPRDADAPVEVGGRLRYIKSRLRRRTWCREVADVEDLSPTTKLVLLVLATKMSYDPERPCSGCWADVSWIAKRVQKSPRTVRRAIQEAQAGGWIATATVVGKDGTRHGNLYVPGLPGDDPAH